MKKICLSVCIVAALLIFTSSAIWEGAAAKSGDLPETGLFMSTNSFPLNSVVEVINLENGRITHLIVHSGLDTAGFLALLSKDAIDALGISEGSLARVRMNQVSDLLALSLFTDGRLPPPGPPAQAAAPPPAAVVVPPPVAVTPPPEAPPVEPEPLVTPPVPVAVAPPQEAPPAEPPPAVEAPPVAPEPLVTPPLPVAVAPPPAEPPPPAATVSRNVFTAPTITSLQMGKFYVQIAAYSNYEAVNPEIARIDSSLPVAVMDAGTPNSPLYRVLIGPLTLGEAGAIIQRVRLTHHDAFVRIGE